MNQIFGEGVKNQFQILHLTMICFFNYHFLNLKNIYSLVLCSYVWMNESNRNTGEGPLKSILIYHLVMILPLNYDIIHLTKYTSHKSPANWFLEILRFYILIQNSIWLLFSVNYKQLWITNIWLTLQVLSKTDNTLLVERNCSLCGYNSLNEKR